MAVVGPAVHERAVLALQDSFRALGGAPVRLRKRTSNLFRSRQRAGAAGLDTAGLADVISIDPAARTADVQGMCTYETLVAATLQYELMPLVVPQLRTITLGGAVTGLGIESSSLRNGLPHESVLELDILVGTGDVVTASPTLNPELFEAFPNSYGSLGYALRLRIALQPTAPLVALRHERFEDVGGWASAVETIARKGAWRGEEVDFVDGVHFSPTETYLTLGRWASEGQASDYTGQQIYYRSIRARERDCLTVADYLWRWDTDWFWCSAAFGAQHPLIRRAWPRRLRRSDVYHRLLAWESRFAVAERVGRWRHQAPRERVVQDIEVPLERLAEFLRWLDREVGMTPVWLCPLRVREPWPLYPLEPGRVYVNVGFWGTVPIREGSREGDVNRAVEHAVGELGGCKSLYSDVFYNRDTFARLYGGDAYESAKRRYDPHGRFTGMYEKVVAGR